MSNYLLKYKGKYRILPELDLDTNDFPRDMNDSICPEYDDIYISCQYGNKIYNYGRGTLCAYIPSVIRGKNIIKSMQDKGIQYTHYLETDKEIEFRFKAKDIKQVAILLKAKTSGAGISPFSKRNLPKSKNVEIPSDEIERYKTISSKVDKSDLLVIHRFTKTFLSTILQNTIRISDKNFDYKKDMKALCMARQIKEYIYLKGLWEDYLKYMDGEIEKFYKNKGVITI